GVVDCDALLSDRYNCQQRTRGPLRQRRCFLDGSLFRRALGAVAFTLLFGAVTLLLAIVVAVRGVPPELGAGSCRATHRGAGNTRCPKQCTRKNSSEIN